MPHRRTPWLTTPSHPFVLAFYSALVILGVLGVGGILNPEGMRNEFGETVTRFWALGRITAGTLALSGAVGATISLIRRLDPRVYLWLEFIGCVLIFVMQGFYEVTVWNRFGWTGVVETQVLTTTFALAGLARAIQLPFQVRLYKATQQRRE